MAEEINEETAERVGQDETIGVASDSEEFDEDGKLYEGILGDNEKYTGKITDMHKDSYTWTDDTGEEHLRKIYRFTVEIHLNQFDEEIMDEIDNREIDAIELWLDVGRPDGEKISDQSHLGKLAKTVNNWGDGTNITKSTYVGEDIEFMVSKSDEGYFEIVKKVNDDWAIEPA